MKKFLVLILSLVCAFAIAFTACTDSSNSLPQESETEQSGGGNQENETPETPDDGSEDEEDEGEGEQPENPETPENPDEGNEDEEDDGEGEQPENPETPENPDEGNEDEEDEGEGKEPEQPEEPETHQCTYSTYWSCNQNYHWHASTCSEHPNDRADYAPHNYVGGRCSECKVSSSSTYKVGDRVPDFIVETFKTNTYTNGNFSSADARGKVLVINFWYVNCGPCVAEIPEMEKVIDENYSDKVVMLALHATGSAHSSDLAAAPIFVEQQGWSNYGIIFGKDQNNDALYKKFGGDGYYPLTVILDSEGIITYMHTGYLMYFDIITMKNVDLFTPAIEAALKNKKV